MADQGLNFSFAVGSERHALLLDAATKLDNKDVNLSEGERALPTELGSTLRLLAEDRAELPDHPEVYSISTAEALADGKPAFVPIEALTDRYDFYLIRFNVGLVSRLGWQFNMLEAQIEFNVGETAMRPKAFTIFPRKEFEELLKLNGGMKVWINEKGELDAGVSLPTLDTRHARLKGGASVSTGANLDLGAEIPTFDWSFRKARIEHSGTGLERVFWRIRDGKFMAGDSLSLMVIAQVPRGMKKFRITAELQAYRYFNLLDASLKDAVMRLGDQVKNLFRGDLPLYQQREWHVDLDAG